MSSSNVPVPVRHRFWIPGMVILLVVIIIGTFVEMPEDRWPAEGERRMYSMMAVLLGSVIIFLWFVFLSRYSMFSRYGVLAVAIAAGIGLGVASPIRRLEFTGDMVPHVDFVWTKDRQEALAEHQKQLTSVEAGNEVNLSSPKPEDLPDYRGLNRDGIIPGPALASNEQPQLLWKHPVGGGYASFAVVDPWAITIELRRDDEAIVCYDVRNGRQRWSYTYPGHFSEVLGGEGPRATPTIAGGKVYALGALGHLTCLDGAEGKLLWQINILDENHVKNVQWGMSGSPLVIDNKVIVNPGTQHSSGESGAVTAFDAETGKLLWQAGQGQAGYSSPMLVTLGGKKQVVVFEGQGVAGYDLDLGKELWRYPWKSDYDVNAVQPLVVDDSKIFISSTTGCALLALAEAEGKWTVSEVWRNRWLKADFSNPILHKGHIYGLDLGILTCLDVETGKRLWKGGRFGHGQLLCRDDMLIVLSEQGELVLVEATPKAFQPLEKIEAIEGKTWNNPALVGERLLVRNHLEMAAFQLPLARAETTGESPTNP